ncbi:unnamed protein product [Effrenium voratum]|nr:unnamed protein product [Effrenium voratum]
MLPASWPAGVPPARFGAAAFAAAPRTDGLRRSGMCGLAVLAPLAATSSLIRRRAVRTDEHSKAVSAWLDRFVLQGNYCPWAKPAQKRRGIRIVSSTETEPEEVFEDLLDEAEGLPMGPADEGEPSTTLLVCPYVEEWKSYGPFRDFYEEDLLGGSVLLDDFDMKVIAFHPEYLKYGFSVEAGDRIAIANMDGSASHATVLDEEGGLHPEDGEELLDVRLDEGEECLVRYSSIITKLATKQGAEVPSDDRSGEAANLLSRAPRPVLHLLRMEDLDAAGLASRAATGPNIQGVLEENAVRAGKLGLQGMAALLRQCG